MPTFRRSEALQGMGTEGGLVKPVHGNGRVGQAVIVDCVGWGGDHPLRGYPQPCLFTIVEVTGGGYVMRDAKGVSVAVDFFSGSFFFDASEWCAFMAKWEERIKCGYDAEIKRLQDRLALLKDILVSQGVRVVSEVQAKELGIAESARRR